MLDRIRVAHHEAAHVVLALRSSAGLSEHGIDLDAPTTVEDAYGIASVNVFDHDESVDEEQQRALLINSLAIICAGAASDAKLRGSALWASLRRQQGDRNAALKLLTASPLIDATNKKEIVFVLRGTLKKTAQTLDDPAVWNEVKIVAQATLDSGGRLTRSQIEQAVSSATRT